MKHKLISVLLVLTLVLCIAPAMTIFASAGDVVAEVDLDGNGTISAGEKFLSVQAAIDAAEGVTDAADAKTVKLLADVEESILIGYNKFVILDLNGHVLSCGEDVLPPPPSGEPTGDSPEQVISVYGWLKVVDNSATPTTHYFTDKYCSHGKEIGQDCDMCTCPHGISFYNQCTDCGGFAICKAKADGCFETYDESYDTTDKVLGKDYIAAEGGCIAVGPIGVVNCGTLILEGGNIVGNKRYGVENAGTFEMNGGSIIGNGGSGVFMVKSSSGTFEMNNGKIKYNTSLSAWGGGVDCANGTFHMYGGEISDNTAVQGGGVYNGSSTTAFHMHGGEIKNNYATKQGGGVFTYTDDCTFDGKCIVKDNTSGKNKVADNVALQGRTFSIGDGGSTKTYAGKGSLSQGSEIHVTYYDNTPASNSGVFCANGTKADLAYFYPDNTEYTDRFVKGDSADCRDLYKKDHLDMGIVVASVDYGTAANPDVQVYFSVSEAIDDAVKGVTSMDDAKTVKLLVDIEENVGVWHEDGAYVIIDLNDHIFSGKNRSVRSMYESLNEEPDAGAGASAIIANEGTLKITDSTVSAGTAKTRYFIFDKCNHGKTLLQKCETCGGIVSPEETVNKSIFASVTTQQPASTLKEGVDYFKTVGGVLTWNKFAGMSAIENYDKLTIEDINIVGCGSSAVVTEGEFIMESGSIMGNFPIDSYYGGAVYLDGGGAKFTMNDGVIAYNCAQNGGGVDCSYGKFHMYGGSIHDNIAYVGGGVHNGISKESFHMHGGEIVNNTALNYGGGVFIESDDCSFDGVCVVKDNYSYRNETAEKDDVCLYYTLENEYTINYISIGDKDGEEAERFKLLDGSEIGVRVVLGEGVCTPDEPEAPKFYVSFNGTADEAEYFFSDSSDYAVKFVEGDENTEEFMDQRDHIELAEASCQVNIGTETEPEVRGFGTLEEAVKKLIELRINNANIKLLKKNEEVFTVSDEITFTVDANGNEFNEANITAGEGYEKEYSADTFTFKKTASDKGGLIAKIIRTIFHYKSFEMFSIGEFLARLMERILDIFR